MQKESIVMGVAGLAFGFVLGITTPKLLGDKTQPAPPPPPQQEQFADTGAPTPQQLEHAVMRYKEVLKDDPENVNALMELGAVYYSAQRFDEAKASFQKVVELDGKHVDAYTQLGNVCYDSNKPKEAIEYYEKALELRPQMSDTRVDLATMYRVSGDPDKALEELYKVNKSEPNHATAYLNLGIILKHDKKDLAGAKQAWSNFLKVMPGGPQAEQVKKMIAELDKELAVQKSGS